MSGLSPYLTHRVLGEWEVALAAAHQHGQRNAEKFIQEVCWRTYWKGWLEHRPQVWTDYLRSVQAAYDRLNSGGSLGLAKAREGNTGIACFDAWANELVATGYLHNHARMWFASIWVFTLKLPWELGADFFMQHLLDGDAASNTLSWRWVGGLQTVGKHYLARPDNIARFTENRFPDTPGLVLDATPLKGKPAPAPRPLQLADDVTPEGRWGLLLLEHDLMPETLVGGAPSALAGALCSAFRSPRPVAEPVVDFSLGALKDGLTRGAEAFNLTPEACPVLDDARSILAWAEENALDTLVVSHPTAGPAADFVAPLAKDLAVAGRRLQPVVRPWDRAAWPHAQKGFFKFKSQIPALLSVIG
ncbi:MAG: FAD-binding domain-containing protein [Pseudomonadota bacterium]